MVFRYGRVYFVCLSNSVCGATTGTFSWSQPYIDYMLTKYDQILFKYDKMLFKYDQISTKYDQNDQIHVGNFQKRHFLEIKKFNAKNLTDFWGLIALTHSNCSDSYP